MASSRLVVTSQRFSSSSQRLETPSGQKENPWLETSDFFEERRSFARKRSKLVAAEPELQERELIKLVSIASAISAVLKQRGASASTASLASEAGAAIFRVGFEQWARDPKDRSLTFHLRAARRQLEGVIAPKRRRTTT